MQKIMLRGMNEGKSCENQRYLDNDFCKECLMYTCMFNVSSSKMINNKMVSTSPITIEDNVRAWDVFPHGDAYYEPFSEFMIILKDKQIYLINDVETPWTEEQKQYATELGFLY